VPTAPVSSSSRRHAVVAGWSGTTNLGDELLLRCLLGLLDDLNCSATVVSRSPDATARTHGVDTLAMGDVVGLWRAVRAADALILGPGTLIQDQTSPTSLPWHLSRVAIAATARRPVAGIGLGAGPLRRRSSRALAGIALGRCQTVAVRDQASAALLAACGVRGVRQGCDLALGMDPPADPVVARVAVSLRAHHAAGNLIPLRQRPNAAWDPMRIAALAASLDAVSQRTGLPLHLVAMDTDADAQFHERVAGHLRSPHTLEVPTLDSVVNTIATSQLVVAMRYHAGVAAVIGGRPVVLIGYAQKVDALAADIAAATGGRAVGRVSDDPAGWAALPGTAEALHRAGVGTAQARDRLRQRLDAHRHALADVLARGT